MEFHRSIAIVTPPSRKFDSFRTGYSVCSVSDVVAAAVDAASVAVTIPMLISAVSASAAGGAIIVTHYYILLREIDIPFGCARPGGANFRVEYKRLR